MQNNQTASASSSITFSPGSSGYITTTTTPSGSKIILSGNGLSSSFNNNKIHITNNTLYLNGVSQGVIPADSEVILILENSILQLTIDGKPRDIKTD